MTLRGPLPSPGAQRRNTPTFSWTEVPNVPYTKVPPVKPPSRRAIVVDEVTRQVALLTATRAWWRVISQMPHCQLWSPSDWLFAAETAVIVDDFYRGDTRLAPEMRQRERAMGTTVDARAAMRIRYVDPDRAPQPVAAGQQTSAAAAPSRVTDIGERRRRLTE